MATSLQKNLFWRRARRIFRRVRVVVWIAVFTIIAALLYLNQIGLPDFIKRPLLEKLRARGVELQFKNLRLSWYRGFVAYDVRFGRAADPAAPRLSATRVQLSLNGDRLRRLDFQIGGLVLHEGRLVWPLAGTNEFALEKLNAELRFLPGDQWQLDNLEAQLADIKIRITGSLTNATALRDWTIFHPGAANTPTAPEQRQQQIQHVADMIARLRFARPPVVRVDFSGDARGRETFRLGVRAQLDDGGLIAQTAVNPTTRELTFVCRSDFDLQKVRPLLADQAGQWLGRFSWEKPPQIRLLGALTLPDWTNRTPDWRGEVMPTLRLDGQFKVGAAAFRGLPVLAAQSRLLYLNQTWRLQDMHIMRPEGGLAVEHWTHEPTRDYYWHLRGVFDPKAVRPLLEPGEQHALDLVGLTTPPEVDLELWSRWYERERTGVKGRVAVSNFTFRGETAVSLCTAVEYTNLWLHLTEPRVTRGAHGEQHGALTSVDVDFKKRLLYLTNGDSTIDPMVIARAVGEKTTHALEPYQFLTPPTAHIEGMVTISTNRAADLHVTVSGGPFHWWKFNVTQIGGDVVWVNQTLVLTNVTGDFYGGRLAGSAGFDFTPAQGNEFHFDMRTTNASLGDLVADLGGKTNQLAGKLTGRLVIPQADTGDFQSWQGYGDMTLRDGQMWEIPVFGIFAPVLNTVYPNLGSGRASDGSATFTITNSIISTENLELRSPGLRMQYRGTVDFAGRLDARAEAEVLRNTAIIGPLVSTVLWPVTKLLEYKITGTLSQPKSEPVYIPKVLLIPLHPFQTIKSIFSSDTPATNAPPKSSEPPTQ